MAPAKKAKGRGKGKPFAPGQSGNPGGRPKNHRAFLQKLTGDNGEKGWELAWEIAQGKVMTKRYVFMGLQAGSVEVEEPPSIKVRLEALQFILDHQCGRAPQSVEIQGEDGGPIKTEATVSHAASPRDFSAALSHALSAGILAGAAGLSAAGALPSADEVRGAGADASPAGVSSP